MSTLGERLREIRTDAEMSQERFAAIAGVQKRAQINYETDERVPDAVYFAKLDAAGYDTHYIITGHPGPDARAKLAPHAVRGAARHVAELEDHYAEVLDAGRGASYRKVAPDEETLLGHYRHADRRGKSAILTTAAALSGGSAQPASQHVSADRGSIAGGRDVSVGSKPRHRKKK